MSRRPANRSKRRPPRARRRFGQHFLAASWAERVLKAVNPASGDVFLEVGPGRGALTLPLARTGAPILAVEIDRDLADDLRTRVPPNVTLLTGDILSLDVVPYLGGLQPQRPAGVATDVDIRRRVRIAANLPYNISSPIIFWMIERAQRDAVFADATIMLQKEVADRLLAKPGSKDYGVLTVLITRHASITRVLDLPPTAFAPPPKVRSSVVRLVFHPATPAVRNELEFERMVKALFSQRRKMLSNALRRFDPSGPRVLELSGLDGRRRPETLQLEELTRLADLFASGTARTRVL